MGLEDETPASYSGMRRAHRLYAHANNIRWRQIKRRVTFDLHQLLWVLSTISLHLWVSADWNLNTSGPGWLSGRSRVSLSLYHDRGACPRNLDQNVTLMPYTDEF